MRAYALLLSALCACAAAHGDDAARAKQNYQLNCMGCHGEEGNGLEGHVPSLRGTLSRISSSPQGREFVLRVPGVTQSALSSEEIAEVLNWVLYEFNGNDGTRPVRPFTAAEVSSSRTRPLVEIAATRAQVLRVTPLTDASAHRADPARRDESPAPVNPPTAAER